MTEAWIDGIQRDGIRLRDEFLAELAHSQHFEQFGDVVSVIHVGGALVVQVVENGGLCVAFREIGKEMDFRGDDCEAGRRVVGCG